MCHDRALRQNKEAAALGLLEGQTAQAHRDADLQVSTPSCLMSCGAGPFHG